MDVEGSAHDTHYKNISLPMLRCIKWVQNILIRPKPTGASPNIKHAIGKSLNQRTVFAAGNWPTQQWWINYQPPELNALISENLVNNPSIQEIHGRITVARQETRVTRSILFPLVFFDATETRQYLSKNGFFRAFNPSLPLNATLLDLSLSFSYELDFSFFTRTFIGYFFCSRSKTQR